MRKGLIVLFVLLVPFMANTEPLAEEKEIIGCLNATQDLPGGILVHFDRDSLDAATLKGLPGRLTYATYIFFRAPASGGEMLPIDTSYGTPHFFDTNAEAGIWYRYELVLIMRGQRINVKTANTIKGVRPAAESIDTELSEWDIYSYPNSDKLHMYIDFTGMDGLMEKGAKIHLQYTTHPIFGWSPAEGMYKDTLNRFSEDFFSGHLHEIPYHRKALKAWLSIRLIHQDGTSRYYYKSVDLQKLRLKPRASLNDTPEDWQYPPLEIQPKEVGTTWPAEKCYALSFVPSNKQQKAESPQDLSATAMAGSYISLLTNSCNTDPLNVAADDCRLDLATSHAAKRVENRLNVFFATYEIPVGKIKQQTNLDKILSPALVTTTNNFATMSKYLTGNGHFVWQEVNCDAEVDFELVFKVQRLLQRMGYYNGEPLGRLNTRTKAAITAYQLAMDFPIGNLDKQTLESLGIQ